MARVRQKLLYILCFISGVLVCYELQLVEYRQNVSSASIYLSKARQLWEDKFSTSQKANIDWTEYWRHEAERKIKGFQNEHNLLQDSIVKLPKKNDIKTNIFVKKDRTVQKNIELYTEVNESKPVNLKKKKANTQRVYYWNEKNESSNVMPLYDNWKDEIQEMAQRIIFNRVPKCGSRSVLSVFKHLAQKNQYNMINSLVYNKNRLSNRRKNLIVNVLLKIDPPFLFQRHMYYFDFRNFSSVSVKYINIIRDPIERFTSEYYFLRFGDGVSDQRKFKRSERDRNQTINECVLRRRSECSGSNLRHMIRFFCGDSPKCWYKDRTPLELAKQNVERDFIVVGLLEELEDTFAVLEKMLPKFFAGAVDFFQKPDKDFTIKRSKTETKRKESPSEKVYAILLEQMALEYELYNYIKERFHKLKLQLGVGGGTKNQAS